MTDSQEPELPAEQPAPEAPCRICGRTMLHYPRLDNSGTELLCPHGHDSQDSLLAFEKELADIWGLKPKPSARFRSLVQQADASGPLPDALLDQLPEKARQMFQARQLHGEKQTAPLPEPLPETEEPLGQPPEEPGKSEAPAAPPKPPARPSLAQPTLPDRITQQDIALLATELEPGALADKERRLCSNCEAVIARSRVRCPWCGEILPPLPAWVD